MENKELEKILDSEIVRCPNKDCESYAFDIRCFTHLYSKCETFQNWYNGLSNEQPYLILK